MHFSRRQLLRLAGSSSASFFFAHALGGCAADAAPAGPWWLEGNYAPIDGESDAVDLAIEGALPPELRGVFLRNGPNPITGASFNWFFGDAMLHGLRLEGGHARWYRSRYIQTHALAARSSGGDATQALTGNYANTALVRHAGRTLALYEGGKPWELGLGDLSTVGEHDFGGMLSGAMGAHPKIDPATGEMWFIGYSPFPPFLTLHRVGADGSYVAGRTIEIPGARMIHDFQLSAQHAIVFDLPIAFELDQIEATGSPFAWRPELGARIGVLRRDAMADGEVRWFEVDPCYVFHSLNAYELGGELIIEAARHDALWADGPDDETSIPTLHRWALDLATGVARESALDDMIFEFPRIDARRQTAQARVAYGLRFGYQERADLPKRPDALVKYDLSRGSSELFELGPAEQPDEAVFAAAGPGEDDGYVLTIAYDRARGDSSLVVFDASAITAGPIARVRLPHRVPFGFHGDWFEES
ncbi:MAG: carotenoid oxygenase family protein [Myxococcota bacterium]|nr:carotenoid oxygenase family protein [Myxococcota bacterium]